jgi:hypothetical protein
VCSHEVPDLRLPGATHQIAQERLIVVNGVDQGAESLGQRQRLAARTAAGVDTATELLPPEEAQDVEGVGVAARAELSHAAEEQADWIGGAHVLLDCLMPQG